ncbi:hypothetical protein EV175_005850, partial [Coemansia sp. RSA 1933]
MAQRSSSSSGYEDFYNSLWDTVHWPVDDKELDAKRIAEKISKHQAAMSKTKDDEKNTLSVTQQQWIESLAVASSFSDPGFSWTTEAIRIQANEWITAIAARLDIDLATSSIDRNTFRTIYMSFVRPYFVTTSQHSTASGYQQVAPQNTYVLMDGGAADRSSGKNGQSDDARWRKNPQCIATFSWALSNLRNDAIADAISSILPVVLALVEDYECQAKLWGLRIATTLLRRKEWIEFMRKSGIVSVIDKSVRACLMYRSDTKEIAADLLASAFEAAVESARILYDDPQKSTYAQGWWLLVDKVVSNEMYVSDNIAASRVLCAQIGVLCGPLGCAVTRYLRPLVGILTQGLRSPVYLSQDICDLHLNIVRQLLVLIDACPQRIHVYGPEIVAALAYSWATSKHKTATGVLLDVDELQQGIVDT